MTEITKEKFMMLANKFFSDPAKGVVFRKYCEDVGIRMNMTIEEMKTAIRTFHNSKIKWASLVKNEQKDIYLPKIENEIENLKKEGLNAITKFGHKSFETLDWTGKPKSFTVSKDARHIRSHNWKSVKEHRPNKVSFVIDDWDSLSKQMKKTFGECNIQF